MSKILQSLSIVILLSCWCAASTFAQWEQPDSIFIQLEDCVGFGEYCLPIPYADIGDYSIKVDGGDYFEMLEGCLSDTSYLFLYNDWLGQGHLGPYLLESWEINGQNYSTEFMDVIELVDSMNVWDILGNWVLNDDTKSIQGGNIENEYSQMVVTSLLTNIPVFVGFSETNGTPQGTIFRFPLGVHKLEVYDPILMVGMNSQVLVACPQDIVNDTLISITDSALECISLADLGLIGQLESIVNNCPSNEGIVAFELQEDCIQAIGTNVGTESACYEVCDEYGFCASFIWNVSVESDNMSAQQDISYTIPVYTEDTHCFDLSQLNGDIVGVMATCPNSSGEQVVFEILNEDTYCINFNAISIGMDFVCYTFTDSDGTILTSIVSVQVTPPSSETVNITLNMGDMSEECPDGSEISANNVTLINDCENNSSEAVNFTTNDVSLCLNIEAVALGIDTACIVLCDENFVCDTTYYVITVIEEGNATTPPVANDDSSQTLLNTSVVINICNNDVIPDNNLTDYYVQSIAVGGAGPTNGTVVFNDDCTISYVPNSGFCAGIDQFTYVICNAIGCDEALVTVMVDCEDEAGQGNVIEVEDLVIHNGFSPNGDNINEVFLIEGIESMPNTNLFIYNRWGNEVYQKHNYKNTWNGMWEDKIVPDGTYFYLLEMESGDRLSGFVELRR